jgi:hypothetical protein
LHNFSALFFGCLFPSLFSVLIELWLPFPFHFASLFVKFCTPFSDPVFACTFYGFVWISGNNGTQNHWKQCFYYNKTMISTKTPNRHFLKQFVILCTISASFGQRLAHKIHILFALIFWCVFGILSSSF